jgi:hypothetical protein
MHLGSLDEFSWVFVCNYFSGSDGSVSELKQLYRYHLLSKVTTDLIINIQLLYVDKIFQYQKSLNYGWAHYLK